MAGLGDQQSGQEAGHHHHLQLAPSSPPPPSLPTERASAPRLDFRLSLDSTGAGDAALAAAGLSQPGMPPTTTTTTYEAASGVSGGRQNPGSVLPAKLVQRGVAGGGGVLPHPAAQCRACSAQWHTLLAWGVWLRPLVGFVLCVNIRGYAWQVCRDFVRRVSMVGLREGMKASVATRTAQAQCKYWLAVSILLVGMILVQVGGAQLHVHSQTFLHAFTAIMACIPFHAYLYAS